MLNPSAGLLSSLPPGCRFLPTDEEFLEHYLKRQILEQPPDKDHPIILPKVDVYDLEPQELSSRFGDMFGGKELFLFCSLKRKYLKGNRSNRRTKTGYWKQTGYPCAIVSEQSSALMGKKKTLVFHESSMRQGKRTSWVMYEYHLNPKFLGNDHDENERMPYVACRIKNNKDNKLIMGVAPTYVNQEGNHSSYCNNHNNEAADDHEAVDAQPEQSGEEFWESLPEIEPLGDISSYCNTTSTHQLQAGVEEGLSSILDFSNDKDGNEPNFGYMPSPRSNPAIYTDSCLMCSMDFPPKMCFHSRS